MPGEQKKVCIDVPYIDQSKLYPTGCESVSTVMLLRFLGIDITVDEFIEKYLEKKSFEERDGQVYGPDPHRYFCGSPYDDESFGCYAPVIREALEKIIGAEYTVTDETGMTTDELVEKYIDQGMPFKQHDRRTQREQRAMCAALSVAVQSSGRGAKASLSEFKGYLYDYGYSGIGREWSVLSEDRRTPQRCGVCGRCDRGL